MKMMIAILIIVGSGFTALAAGNSGMAPQADPIETIRQHHASINKNVPLYRRVKKHLSGFSAEGGELVGYFHGPSVMKLVATFSGETGKSIEEYYYWNGQLIFVLHTDNQYDKPLSGKVVKKTEGRFYFKDDKLISWLDDSGKEIASDSAEYAGKQADYLKTSKQLAEGAKSKSPTIESP
ncbi:MAG TPA: hypothetical protein VLN44_09535 [Pyrinomonadaceae bacterium]|nr:hypothetical protein [Pyrinomonadaceae bacterium]